MAAGGADVSKALPSFFCPITQDVMRDPVITCDGQTYEREEIEEWLADHDTSPATGARLSTKQLTPNLALRAAIEEWREMYGMNLRRADIEIEGRPIAVGSYKSVYAGKLRVHVPGGASRTRKVAVLKIRKGDCAIEAAVFIKLGRHPRLVHFLGQCSDGEDQLLITELAELGSLSDAFQTWEDTITLQHNVAIMQQIAMGMEHLIAEGLLHRDLAARNVLVFSFDKTNVLKTSVKVADYGLAAASYNQSHLTIAGGDRPVRYMPPEALQKGRFSEASDVWATAVTFWEALTLGIIPFFDKQDGDVIGFVCGGGRLARDAIILCECPDALWALITRCWETSPKNRPRFSELVLALGAMRQDERKCKHEPGARVVSSEEEEVGTCVSVTVCVCVCILVSCCCIPPFSCA